MTPDKPIRLCALTTISKAMDWFVVDAMRHLAAHGYEITLISHMDEDFIARNSDFATCISLPMSRGASVHDLLTVPFRLAKIFKKQRFDVLYYTSPNASFYASIGGLLAGTKTRIYNQCGLRYVSFTGLKRRLFKTIERLTCLFSTTVRAQSPLNRQFAVDEKLCPDRKISVVGIGGTIGVDLAACDAFDRAAARRHWRERYAIPQDAFVFGYVGRINADKGLNELLTAFRSLEDACPDAHLILVGMTDEANPLDAALLDYAAHSERVHLTGLVPPQEVYPHMAAFDVLTHPTYREGFGKVLQEAMGMSLPIITTDVPGPCEVVENGVSGLLARVKDADDFAAKMKTLYDDAALREGLATAGRRRAERYFDRPIMLGNILADLDRTLGR